MAGEPSERRGASVSSVSGQQITGHSSMAVRWRGEVGVGVVVVALGLELVLELAGHDPGPFPRHVPWTVSQLQAKTNFFNPAHGTLKLKILPTLTRFK